MKIVDTALIKEEEFNNIKKTISKFSIKPTLAVININSNEKAISYNNAIKRMCDYIGYKYKSYNYLNIEEDELLKLIDSLNNNKEITAILISLPLPKYLNKKLILNAINPNKDVDGLTDVNRLKLFNNDNPLIPTTVLGIIKLFDKYNLDLNGKNIIILNRSNLIGKPLANILLNKNATISICHSKTKNLDNYLQIADIIITAVGIPNLITSKMVSDNTIIVDVGLSYKEGKLVGDFKKTIDKNITLINKTGNMTMVGLALNIMKCYYLNNN